MMKKIPAFLIVVVLCALALPSNFGVSSQNKTPLPAAKFRRLNKAIAGQYPPGSTFKMITALAGLEAGVINEHTSVFCPGHYDFGNGRYHCWKKGGHGSVNLRRALMVSCDTYFYKMSTDVGIDKISGMGKRFGLGARTGLELA